MSTSRTSIRERLLRDLRDEEFRHDYDDEFLDMYISAQIRALREDRKMTQTQLAEAAKTGQSKISEMESEYHSWSLRTLRKLARAFGLRLFVTFESWGELIPHAEGFQREKLVRPSFQNDGVFHPKETVAEETVAESQTAADLVVYINENATTPARTEVIEAKWETANRAHLYEWFTAKKKRASLLPPDTASVATRSLVAEPTNTAEVFAHE